MSKVVCVGLGLLLAFGGSTAAMADHVPGSPVVEGSASARTIQEHEDGTATVLWFCKAVTTGGLVSSTGITCELKQNEIVIDTNSLATEGNVTPTRPKQHILAAGAYQICWTARAFTMHGEFIYDTVEPNCADFTA